MRQEGQRSMGDYAVPSSAPTGKGRFGVEAWFHRSLPSGAAETAIGEKVAILLEVSPILLVVHIPHSAASVLFCVDHALHNFRLRLSKDAWWEVLDPAIRRLRRPEHLLLLSIDANAALGSTVSPSVGGEHKEPRSDNGLRLHRLLHNHSLCVPYTFVP